VPWGVLALVALGVFAFANGLNGVFVFDDVPALQQNPSLERIWPPWAALQPQAETTLSGRPVANLTFALNRVLNGVNPVGYHVGNILIHLCAGLALFGIARRTLLSAIFPAEVRAAAARIALAIAALWLVHPLQTESVTYVVQRVESLMGLWYLLTLYCFIRAVEPGAARAWYALAVLTCTLGMGTKEVMVSAPITVFLYDRTFVAGSLRAAWQQRKRFYLCLAASWLLLAMLVLATPNRGGSAGFAAGVSAWRYGLTQCRAIVLYLRLTVWPHPLVFYYGDAVVRGISDVAISAIFVALLVGGMGLALWRNRAVGWVGFCFFAILAPSSSIVPVATQSMAEHRMYLSLAAVTALIVYGSFRWLRPWCPVIWGVAVVALGVATISRNRVYLSETTVWTDTLAKVPANPRAYDALGNVLAASGRYAEAADAFRHTIAAQPDFVDSYNNLAAMLDRLGDKGGAKQALEQSLEINPQHVAANFNLAELLRKEGDYAGAKQHYLVAIRMMPQEPAPWLQLATIEMDHGDPEAAIEHFREALKLRPNDPASWMNLGILLAGQGRLTESIQAFESAVRVAPDSGQAHYNLGYALARADRLTEAIKEYKQAITLDPKMVDAHLNLGAALATLQRYPEAIEQYEAVLQLDPNHATARASLSEVRMRTVLGR